MVQTSCGLLECEQSLDYVNTFYSSQELYHFQYKMKLK